MPLFTLLHSSHICLTPLPLVPTHSCPPIQHSTTVRTLSLSFVELRFPENLPVAEPILPNLLIACPLSPLEGLPPPGSLECDWFPHLQTSFVESTAPSAANSLAFTCPSRPWGGSVEGSTNFCCALFSALLSPIAPLSCFRPRCDGLHLSCSLGYPPKRSWTSMDHKSTPSCNWTLPRHQLCQWTYCLEL